MEHEFSFDDMTFVAKSELVGDMLRVAVYDAWGDCRLEAEHPAAPKRRAKGRAKSGPSAPSAEEQALDDLIAAFKRKVEDGEIDLA